MSEQEAGPRVAVVVRTKDRPRFLERALRSITRQTLAEWECVIVNDGGDPAAVDAVVSHVPAAQRDRIRVVSHDEARGRWVSANAGVAATSAPLLVLHDDDDSWHPEFLERAAAYLDDPAHADRGGVVSRIEIVWEQVSPAGDYVETGREIFQQQLTAPTLGDTMQFNRFVPIGFVYRRALHDEIGPYDERLPVVGDWNFTLQVLARGPLEYLGDTPYAFWHQRPGQDGSAGNSVIDASGDHAKYDALIRDQALREYVQENGQGLPLYLTKYIDRRLAEMEQRLAAHIENVAVHYSIPERAARAAKKALRRKKK
ncbi:glycosyltransferase family 2 protein [Microbacterium indicum]|uniref:glycosyltransferase family 2 protein n=1 Tax=Microbacterium indicum TaxID=358100 RepID=UPI0003FFC697|nr:glycosyltransferase family A protein [Microbacterium indicum]